MAEIPPAVLRDLNAGKIETITLVECLAIDESKLGAALAKQPGLGAVGKAVAQAAHAARTNAVGYLDRQRACGAAIHAATGARGPAFEKLAGHPSDTVRGWACMALGLVNNLPLAERLAQTQRFAADTHMGVREWAWMSLRPHLSTELPRALKLLHAWARHENANVRRTAIEATRPRGVWCAHIDALKSDPAQALPLLELVRADPSRYVQNSVANWLNDASKHQPDWVRGVTKRWARESKGRETQYICKRAGRSLG